jgi:phage/plasmid primase-like uncharacterized protein
MYKGALVVPVHDAAGELHSLQFISASGTKRFLKGGRVAGLYFLIGAVDKVVCIAEGSRPRLGAPEALIAAKRNNGVWRRRVGVTRRRAEYTI